MGTEVLATLQRAQEASTLHSRGATMPRQSLAVVPAALLTAGAR